MVMPSALSIKLIVTSHDVMKLWTPLENFLRTPLDENNDIRSTKMLVLYIKYCRPTADDCSLMTKTVFAGIVPLARCYSHSILEKIKKFYTTNNIDIQKMVMFTSDGATVMLGKRNGVAKLLKNFVPHIIEQHCVAHTRQCSCSGRTCFFSVLIWQYEPKKQN